MHRGSARNGAVPPVTFYSSIITSEQ